MALSDIYQKASLVQIPSGYKSGTLYSVVPNTADGDFTVTGDPQGEATRVNKDGLIETVAADVPRLNYDPTNPQDPHLLLEPTRLNRVYPNNTLSGYSTLNATISDNNATSPDGASNASKITSGSGGSTIGIYRGFSGNGGNYHNMSVFLKKGTYDRIKVQEGFASANMVVNLTTGAEVSSQNVTNKKIEEYPNGWYRVSFDFISNANNNLQYSLYADGTTAIGINFYTFGGQIEQGKGVTSLIPTVGGIVTRTQDRCFNGGDANLFNDSEGVLFADLEALGEGTTTRKISLSNGNTSFVNFNFNATSGRVDFEFGSTLNSFYIVNSTGHTLTNRNKIAIKYKSGDTDCFINGTRVTGNNGTFSLSGLDRVNFENRGTSGSQNMFAKIHQLMVFNEALTDSELQALTS